MTDTVREHGWRPSAVHPLALLFPALLHDDLAGLAEDIKANGLMRPLTIDSDGVLIDGRTRLAACELAGVEPRWEGLNGHDAEAFIWAANVKRRQMTKGQMAMVGAMAATSINPDKKLGRPSKGVSDAAKRAGVAQASMTKAFLVRDYAIDLVEQVISGMLTLDSAHEQGQARKREAEWREDGLGKLRSVSPELASRVTDGEISVEQGRKLHEEQLAKERDQRDSLFLGFANLAVTGSGFTRSAALSLAPAWLADPSTAKDLLKYFPGGVDDLRARIAESRAGLDAVESMLASLPKGKK